MGVSGKAKSVKYRSAVAKISPLRKQKSLRFEELLNRRRNHNSSVKMGEYLQKYAHQSGR